MPDPDLEIREVGVGGWGRSSEKIFSAVWVSVWSKIKGGAGPRDPPMLFDNKTSSMNTLSSMNNHDDGSTAEKRSEKVTLKK